MPKIPPTEVKRIGIFRVLQLGDMLCAIPAIRALRAAYPEARITLISLPWAKSFTERFNQYFDDFVHFPGYPALPEQPFDARKTVSFLNAMQQEPFDLLLQMQGNGTIVNPLIELFGAKHTGGYYSDYRPNEEYFYPYPNHGHEIDRHLELMDFLGIEPQGRHLEFPITSADEEALQALNLPIERGKYVCIHPGARATSRQWPPEYYAALADYAIESGYQAVLTGTKEEAPILERLISHMKHQPINTAGQTSVGAVAVLIKNSAALVSNCTGVAHIASALQTPSIVISLDVEPERWAPLNRELHRLIIWADQPDYEVALNAFKNLLVNRSTETVE
ncbi:glycosyltransferase family 9 protein [Mucilaginibacter sp. RS28]|uniref:Glycosyltransferase family 9 protein n=1 Tax=Mucilaginibacter straminoryzae TaxID=2932774 RepID=A0A9X1WZW0_9SPHI|nr:glycosyltransferase family 9 protein [Mucilaginibacter straminoryzae]MCJ8208692.1 glycosyltransferase family 9 protein [Mucilaginibacter straminoryzae]